MESKDESHMGSRGEIVHVSKCNDSIAHSFFEHLHRLISRRDVLLSNILNVNAFCFVLSYLQVQLAWV